MYIIPKWMGLRPRVIKRHNVEVLYASRSVALVDRYANRALAVDGYDTCALCWNYMDNNCVKCPLALSRNGARCDAFHKTKPEVMPPWSSWVKHRDPFPMIRALKAMKKWIKKTKWTP